MLAITNQTTIFFGIVIDGGLAVLINLFYLIVIVSVVLGLRTKHSNAWNITVAWFSFELINSVVSMYAQGNVYSAIYDIILSAFAFITLIDAVIIWYLFKIKKHFTKGVDILKYDKEFIITISTIMILAIIVVFTFSAYHFINITKETDKVVDQLKLKPYSHAKIICNSKSTIEKDVCLLTMVAKYDEATAVDCNSIDSNFYKFTCIRATK